MPSAPGPFLESRALSLEKMSPMEIVRSFKFKLLKEVWSQFKAVDRPAGDVYTEPKYVVKKSAIATYDEAVEPS